MSTAKEMKEISTAFQHRTRFPETEAHQSFMIKYAQKLLQLSQKYPYVDFEKEQNYFRK